MMLKMRFSKERVNNFQVDKVRACHHKTEQIKRNSNAKRAWYLQEIGTSLLC